MVFLKVISLREKREADHEERVNLSRLGEALRFEPGAERDHEVALRGLLKAGALRSHFVP